ncbi:MULTISPECIES: phosphogluconate dehydrogenase (NAD(+)-dependent, decarboxylating) [Micromonospora]|uniref:6-phosphogluconate dehydrogenase n=3 Tax=Micromonospora TaxID=1873 RepID=A0A9X0I5F0_9ACTN|nr:MULTISPECIES: decarboxylating 6-phosphogluconate dehydrogenase [Micromonospora]AEB47978.1 6-phosphogluconate dehydrogenase-like protein [Micromonospora maris AB-18-032]KUJ46969.1 6-phosphogluconate dehydrogenase [Micromonospora maris]MBL6277074.1 decarboxylating 6-phosphogluconate dehydrogenase [Micromonospora fiedleri]PMR59936.1 6-phosphogluconate dehydrogenase (decarboxylating) [Verrucosispora sp. ts21]RUL91556.1 decarboxylating 6-phosphogluconate dehydrogenase [Verrucosispora sp. FIM0600
MQLGLVGLGRMGGNMRERLRAAGHEVVGLDHNAELSDVANASELAEKLAAPRAVWVMVPAAVTDATIDELAEVLGEGDIIIDGGNSRFSDDAPRAERLNERGIGYVDVGVSGGVWGRQNGYGLMVGGSQEHVDRLMPIFEALKPEGDFGFVHAGPVGAGHYAKMVHNGIEYGLMHAYAEGYELMTASELVTNVPGVIKSWREGTVVRSWLLDLLDRALDEDPELAQLTDYTEDTGEGRWTVDEAVRLAVPLHVITASLYARFASRQDESPALKAVSALRQQFGGHAVRKR